MRTHDEQDRPEVDEISDRALDAAWAALPSHGAPSRGDLYEALRAAAEVQAADDQAHADKLVAETSIAGFNLDGKGTLSLVLAHELAAKMTLAFKAILDAQPGAENYVEQEIIERNGGERYVFIVCKPGGKTPHALRREAEAERDQLRADVETWREYDTAACELAGRIGVDRDRLNGILGRVANIAMTWRENPDVYPDGAADPLEQIAYLLIGPRGQERAVNRPKSIEGGDRD